MLLTELFPGESFLVCQLSLHTALCYSFLPTNRFISRQIFSCKCSFNKRCIYCWSKLFHQNKFSFAFIEQDYRYTWFLEHQVPGFHFSRLIIIHPKGIDEIGGFCEW